MDCDVCKEREKNPYGYMWVEDIIIRIEFCGDEVYLSADRDYPEPKQKLVPIKYCPFCGRRF
jgi:hypothetical protein